MIRKLLIASQANFTYKRGVYLRVGLFSFMKKKEEPTLPKLDSDSASAGLPPLGDSLPPLSSDASGTAPPSADGSLPPIGDLSTSPDAQLPELGTPPPAQEVVGSANSSDINFQLPDFSDDDIASAKELVESVEEGAKGAPAIPPPEEVAAEPAAEKPVVEETAPALELAQESTDKPVEDTVPALELAQEPAVEEPAAEPEDVTAQEVDEEQPDDDVAPTPSLEEREPSSLADELVQEPAQETVPEELLAQEPVVEQPVAQSPPVVEEPVIADEPVSEPPAGFPAPVVEQPPATGFPAPVEEMAPQQPAPVEEPVQESIAQPAFAQFPEPVAESPAPVVEQPPQQPLVAQQPPQQPVVVEEQPPAPVEPPVVTSPPPAEQPAPEPVVEEKPAPVEEPASPPVVEEKAPTREEEKTRFVQEGGIFIEKPRYIEVLLDVAAVERKVKEAAKHVQTVANDEVAVTDKIKLWHNLLSEIDEKLMLVDQRLFEKGEM